MARPNKLEGLSLETLSSQVLELEGKAWPTQLEHIADASFLGKLLVLPEDVRLDWKVFAWRKHSSFFGLVISNGEKKFYNIDTRCVSSGIKIKKNRRDWQKPECPAWSWIRPSPP
jgi:hypothetical protein